MALTANNWHGYLTQLADRIEDTAKQGRMGLVHGDPRALRDLAKFLEDSPAPRLVVPELEEKPVSPQEFERRYDDLKNRIDWLYEVGSEMEADLRRQITEMDAKVNKVLGALINVGNESLKARGY